MSEGAWLLFEGADVTPDDKVCRSSPAATKEEIEMLKQDCLELGYGGFVVKKAEAKFRPFGREFLLAHKTAGIWDRGCVLHVAPLARALAGCITVSCGETQQVAAPDTLAAKSGYFASLYRHTWSDTNDQHSFLEFPGGEKAFRIAMSWLAAEAGVAVGEPWPLKDCPDVGLAIDAAAYLDAPRLLRAAVRSWNLASERPVQEQLMVAAAVVEATLQFEGEDQDLAITELRQLLQDVPRHELMLTPAFMAAPAAGLAVLQAKQAARMNLASHIKKVSGRVFSAIQHAQGSRPAQSVDDEDAPMDPNIFAVRLFDLHEQYFLAHPPALRKLFVHIDRAVPIAAPLCFRVAAAAFAASDAGKAEEASNAATPASADQRAGGTPAVPSRAAGEEEEVFDGYEVCVDIFQKSISCVDSPAEAAADVACVSGLFGAGQTSDGILGHDVLIDPSVPPAAAAVVLSRVLSSWAAGESGDGKADAADVILAGVISDRQKLRTMLSAVLPRIASTSAVERGTDWGTCSDYAVPELQAALVRSLSESRRRSSGRPGEEEAVKLLFRVLFQPTGGLPGFRFPLPLLGELRSHNEACVAQAARCAVAGLQEIFNENSSQVAWKAAEETWPVIVWDAAEPMLLQEAVDMLREWLAVSRRAPPLPDGRSAKALAKAAATRLLLQLPLHKLPAPEVSLSFPVPAHVLATLAHRGWDHANSRIIQLEERNEALQREVSRLSSELRNRIS